MELHPLFVDRPPEPGPVDAGWARSIRQPRTVAEILAGASREMDEQDERERQAADPITYIRAERRRRTLWGRLFGRR